MLLEINNHSPQFAKIKQSSAFLKNGGVIVYPTDTIYGVGADIFNKTAIERIYKIKHKKSIGFSFICSDLTEIAKYAIVSDQSYKIMKRVLPGPFTFVFKATKLVPKLLVPNKKTVAIRIPDNKICLEIVKQLSNPIISTSVNMSGEEPYSDPLEIEKSFGDKVDLIIDAGILEGEPSTVIDFSGDVPVLVRQGAGDASSFLTL